MINRNNYEEFFLLYVDDELGAQDKTAVENFVNQNPDVAEELKMLQQATLDDNTVLFAEKNLLYKEEKGISLANYQEYFLLFADKELTEQQNAEIENFVLKHPLLQAEFSLLQKVKLVPELIAFQGKKVLYRYEKNRRIIPASWMRISAAAAIIGIIITTIIVTGKENNHYGTVFNNSKKIVKASPENKSLAQKPAVEKTVAATKVKKDEFDIVKNTQRVYDKPLKAGSVKINELKNSEKPIAAIKPKTNEKQKSVIKVKDVPIEEPAIADLKNPAHEQIKTPTADDDDVAIIKDEIDNDNHLLAKQKITATQPATFLHAVYIEADDDQEEKTVYIGAAEINKNKLKGLFKKAAVFLDKKILKNNNHE